MISSKNQVFSEQFLPMGGGKTLIINTLFFLQQRKTMANNVINLETTLLGKKYIATKKRYELLKHFQ
jgi:hypothetical protein